MECILSGLTVLCRGDIGTVVSQSTWVIISVESPIPGQYLVLFADRMTATLYTYVPNLLISAISEIFTQTIIHML